jgi:ribosome biogenesis GTPase
MNLHDLGLTPEIKEYFETSDLTSFEPARVIRENRERYIVSNGENSYEAEITGNLRFTATSREDFPAVGDWVAVVIYDELAIIQSVLPRRTILERQAVGAKGERQIIAANIDYAFIMQSADMNFNLNRLERYLSLCYTSGIEPILILSKTDLAEGDFLREAVEKVEKREKKLEYLLLSNLDQNSIKQVSSFIRKGKTYCIVGSSGVGKSTLINNLLKNEVQKTGDLSDSTGKGRHITGHRELFILGDGGIIIDTPGMKELGMTDNIEGIRVTFSDISSLALKCKFSDCRHIDESGCAVLDAVEKGMIDKDSLANYRKMLREQEHFSANEAERRKKSREFGKMVKRILKEKKNQKPF